MSRKLRWSKRIGADDLEELSPRSSRSAAYASDSPKAERARMLAVVQEKERVAAFHAKYPHLFPRGPNARRSD